MSGGIHFTFKLFKSQCWDMRIRPLFELPGGSTRIRPLFELPGGSTRIRPLFELPGGGISRLFYLSQVPRGSGVYVATSNDFISSLNIVIEAAV